MIDHKRRKILKNVLKMCMKQLFIDRDTTGKINLLLLKNRLPNN